MLNACSRSGIFVAYPAVKRWFRLPGFRKGGGSEWAQVVRQQDGSYAYHDLPRPLVDVLEDPSPEKIRAYFEWKLRRAEKILRAAEAMKEYRRSVGPPPGKGAPEEEPGGEAFPPDAAMAKGAEKPPFASRQPSQGPAGRAFTVTYFHRAGCHHCDTQDGVLAAWLKDKPEAKLVAIEFGSKPELWRQYNVRGTPSLVIEDQISRKAVFLEGLSREGVLEEALKRSRQPESDPSARREGARQ